MSTDTLSTLSSPNLLVTGSAGYVGKALVRRLADQHKPVRTAYNMRLPEPTPQMEPIYCDLLKPELVRKALEGIDTVIHLAWDQSFRSRWEEAFWAQEGIQRQSKNITMVKNLISSMEESKTKRIIFLSALGSSRRSESWFLQEKYFVEALILNSKIPQKIIVRTTLAYSEIETHDKFTSSIGRLMRFPWFYPVPRFRQKLAPIHVNDLADKVIRLCMLSHVEQANLVEVSGAELLDIEEVFRFVSLGIGKGTHIAVTGFLGQILLPFYEQLNKKRSQSAPDIRDLLTVGNTCDKAIELNNPILVQLPEGSRRFQQTVVSRQLAPEG